MARLFVTGFQGQNKGVVRVNAFYEGNGLWSDFVIENVAYDPTIATSVRQQIQDDLVAKANTALTIGGFPEHANLIASDIEFVS